MEYTVIRSKRKTISLELRPDGLLVHAPRFATKWQIDRFVKDHELWIEKHRQKLEESISETAGDDYTLAFMSFGYGDFRSMQDSVRERAKRLRHDYMDWMEQDPSLEMQEHLWEEYRAGYERFL